MKASALVRFAGTYLAATFFTALRAGNYSNFAQAVCASTT